MAQGPNGNGLVNKARPDKLVGGVPEDPIRMQVLDLLQNLRLQQIELEAKSEELQAAQADLEAARARYFDLYNITPVGYLKVSEWDSILEANVRAAALFATPRASLNGRIFRRLIVGEEQSNYFLSRKCVLDTGTPQVCELKMVRPDKAPFWARLELSLSKPGDSSAFSIVIVDITDRKIIELQLQQHERQLNGRSSGY
jgi:PAS domain S-box-containing protein